jgi:lipoprotein-anchoring transpeptidase ErfK/SrfK
MKFFVGLTIILMSLVIGQIAKADAALDQLAEQSPGLYEIYRKYRADNATTLDEFLEWATPQEIAADVGLDDSALPVANAGPAIVQINVYLAEHMMTMSTPQRSIEDSAKGSDGRAGYERAVPRGCFVPLWLDKNAYSRKFHAPMPNAVFFTKYGHALHAGSITYPSHGCIHLRYATSQAVYDAVSSYGSANTSICIHN